MLVDDGDGFMPATNMPAGGTDLHVVATHSGAIEAGSDRELWRRTESGVWSRCALDVGGLVEFGPMLVADTSGRLVRYVLNVHSQVREYCAYSTLPEDPLLSSSFAPCGLSHNPMLLSASTLWIAEGTSLGCAVAP